MRRVDPIFLARLRRLGSAALLVYQIIFLNVFLPGHQRGAITLDGRHSAGGGPACCCCLGGNDAARSERPKQAPSQRDRDDCAVCNFAAHVTPAPAIQLAMPELRLLQVLPPPAPAVAISPAFVGTYLGRAPPAFS